MKERVTALPLILCRTYACRLSAVGPVRTKFSRQLGASLVCLVLLLAGCAAPTGTVRTQESQTLRGVPVKITSIPVPNQRYVDAQGAAGSVWAAHGSMSGFHKTLKIDTRSHQVTLLPRPWTSGGADLLVADSSLWLSDGATRLTGNGDLYRFVIETNQPIATVKAAGIPFGFGDGALWAFNPRTRIVSGVDTKTNQVRKELPLAAQEWRHGESFTFGDGAIWQTAFLEDVSALQLAGGVVPQSVVRRIDPHTNRVIAEIPIGPFLAADRIRFVAGAIWVLGEREKKGKPIATRIDVNTNAVVAAIPLTRSMESACGLVSAPKTPVLVKGAVWVATFCSTIAQVPYVLLKIDLATNQVTDELRLLSHKGIPENSSLATGDGALWAFDGPSAVRIDFLGD